jgi:multidrug resistance efflux pump
MFARSIRSLMRHRPATPLVVIACGLAALLAWTGWLFWAQISVWERTGDARLELEGEELRVVGRFASSSAHRLRPGQPARLRLHGYAPDDGAIAAVVTSVGDRPSDGHIQVVLRIPDGLPDGIPAQQGLLGEVEIEVERTSPAVLLARAAGRLGTPGTP